jgi:hypothetical protein
MATKNKLDPKIEDALSQLMTPERQEELKTYFESIPPVFQQFLFRFIDVRDSVIINFIADDEKFAKKIADKVRGDVAETYTQLERVLNEILLGQKTISDNIVAINTRLSDAEEKVKIEEERIEKLEVWKEKADVWAVKKKQRIDDLRNDFDNQKKEIEELAKIKPTLDTIQKSIKWWKPWKIIIIAIVIILFFMLLNIVSHKTGIVDLWNDKQGNVEQVFKDMKAGHIDPTVRSVGAEVRTNEDIKQDQDKILLDIKKRNDDYEKKFGHKLIN